MAQTMKLGRDYPSTLIKYVNPISNYFFSAKSKETKSLISDYHSNVNQSLLKWSLEQIDVLEECEITCDCVRIHGRMDKIITSPSHVDYELSHGGHLMVHENADEVTEIIQSLLFDN